MALRALLQARRPSTITSLVRHPPCPLTIKPLATSTTSPPSHDQTTSTSSSSDDFTPPPPLPDLSHLSAEDKAKVQEVLRAAQASEALLDGFERGSSACLNIKTPPELQWCMHAGRRLVQDYMVAARTRPSLLMPLAGTLGAALGVVPPIRELLAKGLRTAVHEQLENNVRVMLTLQHQQEVGSRAPEAGTVIKEYFKKRRDGLPMPDQFDLGSSEDSTPSSPQKQAARIIVDVTKTFCSALLAASSKL